MKSELLWKWLFSHFISQKLNQRMEEKCFYQLELPRDEQLNELKAGRSSAPYWPNGLRSTTFSERVSTLSWTSVIHFWKHWILKFDWLLGNDFGKSVNWHFRFIRLMCVSCSAPYWPTCTRFGVFSKNVVLIVGTKFLQLWIVATPDTDHRITLSHAYNFDWHITLKQSYFWNEV